MNAIAEPFGVRLHRVFTDLGRLCVGIDPHAYLLQKWGFEVTAASAREFGLRVVESSVGRAGIVKPQVAFFEQFGSAGISALERVLKEARDAQLVTIADAKRGDIGSTMDGYATAWLTPGSPLEADGLTVSPYLGLDSLAQTRVFADQHNKSLFVLAATSNPEAASVQMARHRDSTLASAMVDGVARWNNKLEQPLGNHGVVIGATVDLGAFQIREPEGEPFTPILAPGFGAQGVSIRDASELFGPHTAGVIVSESRSLLEGGANTLADEISRHNELTHGIHD